MPHSLRRSWVRLTALVLAVVLGASAGALLFAWSGVYNVAASAGHWWITKHLLTFGMRSSVRTHAIGIDVPPLDDANLARLGAAHFESGCAPCHGSPNRAGSPIAHQMLPAPPFLPPAIAGWETAELFWIVKHGLKYTSMPGWVAIERDDEIWAVTAFLRQLPEMNAERYRELAMGGAVVPETAGRDLAVRGALSASFTACGRCHGIDGRPPASNLVPRLGGQPMEYLYAQLKAYAQGTRRSGFMQPVAAALDDEEMREIAGFYTGLTPHARPEPATVAPAGRREEGRLIATAGVPDQDIPACDACHGRRATDRYPWLAGQHGAYIAAQLRRWKTGGRGQGELAAIMSPIAQRLTDEQIDAVAAYYDSLPPEALSSPEAKGP